MTKTFLADLRAQVPAVFAPITITYSRTFPLLEGECPHEIGYELLRRLRSLGVRCWRMNRLSQGSVTIGFE